MELFLSQNRIKICKPTIESLEWENYEAEGRKKEKINKEKKGTKKEEEKKRVNKHVDG